MDKRSVENANVVNTNVVEVYKHSRKQNVIFSMASLSDVYYPNKLRYKCFSHVSGLKKITDALRGDFENVGQFIKKATRELQIR